MAEERVQRRLAAILAADAVGYSRLMGEDEEGTLAALNAHRSELIEPCIAEHRGRVVKTMGDGLLAEFASVVDAVRCAISFQDGMRRRNADTPENRRLQFRIGVNLGDVIVQGDDVYGDGVNVAARLEGLAEPGGVVVSGKVYEEARSKLDVSFDDLGPQEVKNIAEPVHAYSVFPARAQAESAPPLPDKPSIAVLPFENMSGDPEQEYFSDGITEDIITELTKISGLLVIARHSSFVYKGKAVSLKQVGKDLGVRCVLEGSVRKVGNRLRITAQLIDAASDHHLWAQRYDRDLEDIFAVQDEVARQVAEALSVALKPGESERLAHAPTDNLEVYDLYIRARRTPYPPTRVNILSAQNAYARVIDIEPEFAGGYAGKSLMYSMSILFGQSDEQEDAATAMELARRAVELDNEFAMSHSALALAYCAVGRHEDALGEARRAVELQPGDADTHANHARVLVFAGMGDEAIEAAQAAMRLDPQFFDGPYLNILGRAFFLAGRYEEAVETYQRNDARGGPRGGTTLAHRVATFGHLGRIDEARDIMKELLRHHPDLTLGGTRDVHQLMIMTEAEMERLIDGLRKAGLPE